LLFVLVLTVVEFKIYPYLFSTLPCSNSAKSFNAASHIKKSLPQRLRF